jgi:UDP-glucose 4-epimerase
MATTLILGGNGFIGSHLVEALRREGHRLRVVDVGPPRTDVDWSDVDYRVGSVGDPAFIRACLDDVDIVYHLASTTVPSTSNLDPIADVNGNLVASLVLLGAMIERQIRRIVFFSSGGTVYGNPTTVPVREDHRLNPISSYGVVKGAIERYLLMYSALGQMSPVILRAGNPYGPRQSSRGVQGVIASFLSRVKQGQALEVWGDGSIVRDYIYISDLIGLAVSAGAREFSGVLNAGGGHGASILDLIAVVRRATGCDVAVNHLSGRGYDVQELVLDISLARKELGWAPSVSLDEGVASTWQWLQEH